MSGYAFSRAGAGKAALSLVGVGVLIGIWFAGTLVISQTALPLPQAVVSRLYENFVTSAQLSAFGLPQSGFGPNLLFTLVNVLIAVSVGTAAGATVGVASSRIGLVRAILNPILAVTATVPVLVVIPMFLVWFGTGRFGALLLVAFYTSVILMIFGQRAGVNLDPVFEDCARTFGASPRRVLLDILLPATLPEILGGFRIALAGAWGLEVIMEVLGSDRGLGALIQVMIGQSDTTGIIAAVVLLGVVAVLLDGVSVLGVKAGLRWRAV